MKTNWLATSVAALSIIVLGSLQSCNDKEDSPAAASGINLTSTSLGNVLTDEKGRTVYAFANDYAGASTCTGNCLQNWPIFYRENPQLGTGLNAADFATITNADGTKQTTFKGWPLYYYKDDAVAGDVKGENVGNIWFVVKPSYSIMFANGQLVGQDGKSYTSAYKEGTGKTIFFTDGAGRTLYAFNRDKFNTNNFTKADFSNNAVWPIYEETLKDLPSTLDKTQFGTITVAGNHTQLTYKGWPLYYYQTDQGKRGPTTGVSVPTPGVWPVVTKDTPTAPAK